MQFPTLFTHPQSQKGKQIKQTHSNIKTDKWPQKKKSNENQEN